MLGTGGSPRGRIGLYDIKMIQCLVSVSFLAPTRLVGRPVRARWREGHRLDHEAKPQKIEDAIRGATRVLRKLEAGRSDERRKP